MQLPTAESEDPYFGTTKDESSAHILWNLRMTTTRKPLVADQVTIQLFLRTKPLLRQLPVYFKKKWCDNHADSYPNIKSVVLPIS